MRSFIRGVFACGAAVGRDRLMIASSNRNETQQMSSANARNTLIDAVYAEKFHENRVLSLLSDCNADRTGTLAAVDIEFKNSGIISKMFAWLRNLPETAVICDLCDVAEAALWEWMPPISPFRCENRAVRCLPEDSRYSRTLPCHSDRFFSAYSPC